MRQVVFLSDDAASLPRLPVFHRITESDNRHEHALTPVRWRLTSTGCGWALIGWRRESAAEHGRITPDQAHVRFRLDHAQAIGRPCRRCYPKGIEA